ncbi:MAG: 3-oxoacyl-ACP synthase [Candidatus Omnitrophica bacterium CG11_big_fil_rev_8_21_14_0_20_45_26]|uniref:Beta-ketoacyl-[acyl-carrier-protein] synthase III n=1 Tax=Candidatus Abzuiibacterium crystallinum TaxID=1974748 RepID=A0A2H0LSG0_9BACT|nr:MAG: 3-oxoacyl-ACP synthase [Candidatus Omnitrophica bacterium CG11_big_fil_rev_8_21_14_0_20_45_26]PIW65040.1 MAG: 3-oxoacyl-ACP synthase [Candidatus Omnitrophica bacterium CG12_big_fil_rev_8_21_14_0_65_45_16]
MKSSSVRILGLGAFVPEKVLTNFDLEKMVDTSDEWIRTRTGIQERHIAEPGTAASDLGAKAALEALAQANLKATQIDLIIVATATPDMTFPSTGCVIQQKIGAVCPAFDLSAACSGFVYGLSVAEAYIRSGLHKHILVIGTEITSSFIDWKDRATCVLFGDGAGAAVLGVSDKGPELLGSYLGSDGEQADILKVPAGGSALPLTSENIKEGLQYLKMSGGDVFKIAVRTMDEAIQKICQCAQITPAQIDCLIPHQANLRILQAVADRVKLPIEKVFINVERYGNMSAASTVVALYEAAKFGKLKNGQHVVLVAFGGGLTWGANIIRW